MEYKVEGNDLFRILEDGSKQRLGFVVDNGRGDPIPVGRNPIEDKWVSDCEKYGLPLYNEHEPIPFWDDGKDIDRAVDEFYKRRGE